MLAVSAFLPMLLHADDLTIHVQYPAKNQQLPAVDSTFIFGMVTPGSDLQVNGVDVPVHRDGGFLAFIDISPGEFSFELKAQLDGQIEILDWPVTVADRYRAVPTDSLAIHGDHKLPAVYQELLPGDLVEVSFRGTPGGEASFSIDGVVSDAPMVENLLSYDSWWGHEVFGQGAIDDSTVTDGVYRGSLYLPDSADVDSARVIFTLVVPIEQIQKTSEGWMRLTRDDTDVQYAVLTDTASGRITVRKHEYPAVVELIDSVQTIRTGPRKGYLSIFQQKGIRFICDGRYDNYLRMKLAPGQTAWLPDSSVVFLPQGSPAPHSYVRTIRATEDDEHVRIELFLDEKLPFQVDIIPEENKAVLRVFYCSSDTDWIRRLGERKFVRRIDWSQEQDGVYRVDIDLNQFVIWGWDAYYNGNILTLDIKPAPERFRSYRDLRIMIDPGHSGDPGAIGPTGLTEAEANLMIADRLAAHLRKKGATVFMTRVDDSDVKLYDRPRLTKEKNCDIFISVHNNSVPNGVNPYDFNGVSTYYYHAHSMPLAERVQVRAVEILGLPDYGLYHANFAVIRPPQYLAILVECAFIIIPEQEAALRTESFQEKCAMAIVFGLDDYLRSISDH
jgi:N-acetylmuramoyl-L-alanine amidase